MHQISHHVVRIELDPAGRPLGASATTYVNDGEYRTKPIDVGPFDLPGDVLDTCMEALDIQLSLW